MKRIALPFFILVMLAACSTSPAPQIPTPLPTAVPPAESPGEPSSWAVGFTHAFPADAWAVGTHRYAFYISCPFIFEDDVTGEWHFFEVSEDVAPQPGEVYLRLNGLSREPFSPVYMSDTIIHPSQPTVAAVYLVGVAEQAARLAEANCEVLIAWDNNTTQTLTAEEPFQP
jgi:hypothetical protein